MKRVWWSVGVLLLIVVLCAWGAFRVNGICRSTEDMLRQAETCVYLGDYEGARQEVFCSHAIWKKHEGFLGIMLRHTETDDIDVMFPAVMESLRQKNEEEFFLRNRELIASFRSISRMELPYYFNVL